VLHLNSGALVLPLLFWCKNSPSLQL